MTTAGTPMQTVDKLDFVRAGLAHLRATTSDPMLFAAVERLAETEGAFLTATLTRFMIDNLGAPAMEDEAGRMMERYIKAAQAILRRDGVPEREVAAYTAIVGLTGAARFAAIRGDLREAERVGRQ